MIKYVVSALVCGLILSGCTTQNDATSPTPSTLEPTVTVTPDTPSASPTAEEPTLEKLPLVKFDAGSLLDALGEDRELYDTIVSYTELQMGDPVNLSGRWDKKDLFSKSSGLFSKTLKDDLKKLDVENINDVYTIQSILLLVQETSKVKAHPECLKSESMMQGCLSSDVSLSKVSVKKGDIAKTKKVSYETSTVLPLIENDQIVQYQVTYKNNLWVNTETLLIESISNTFNITPHKS